MDTWGCDRIKNYRVYKSSFTSSGFDLLAEVEDPFALIPDMEPNELITIGVSLVNSANLESNMTTLQFRGRKYSVMQLY